jgi:small subunit ribosomal protein S17
MASILQYGGRKVREGTVVSDKMQKTVVVAVETLRRHPLYKKTVRRFRRYMAHDDADTCRTGDRVRIVEWRPMARHKRWRVVEVLARAEAAEVEASAIDLELLGEVKAVEEASSDQPEEAP